MPSWRSSVRTLTPLRQPHARKWLRHSLAFANTLALDKESKTKKKENESNF
jgi:hypothetical protein